MDKLQKELKNKGYVANSCSSSQIWMETADNKHLLFIYDTHIIIGLKKLPYTSFGNLCVILDTYSAKMII